MSRAQAIADLAAATAEDVLGGMVNINGTDLVAVKRNLTQEELVPFTAGRYGGDGMLIEGVRLTVTADNLSYEPVAGGEMTVDWVDYTVRTTQKIGLNRRITLTRFAA